MSDLIPSPPPSTAQPLRHAESYLAGFDALVSATLATVAVSSARIYGQTFALWQAWCARSQLDPLAIFAAPVLEFLRQQQVTAATRQRQLSALRKLAKVLAVLDFQHPARKAAYESLLLIRAPAEGIRPNARPARALNPTQAIKVLDQWGVETLIQARNRALIALLFLTAMRRGEAAIVRWSEIDLEEGVVFVRHGKGEQPRTVAIAGTLAVEALRTWRALQGSAREYVFCAIGKGDRLGEDAPMSDQAVYLIVKQTEKHSGVLFSPHDARRTFITEALLTGTPLADVQAQAGHKQESTTLKYAKPVEARHRRQRLHLRYGE